ncbi:glycosyltransferase [Niveibacterium sp. COAC-50]|uniref:glycosyltransferase family protein n=1 Tax=Niveibacterium sp. COAC-50 TaxID=2729384 RepID=UPI001552BA00|nr:glycosyltransferase [Niveibacterium sp. COAC-50]
MNARVKPRTLFLTHEQRVLYFEEPGYTEIIQPMTESRLLGETSIHNYQREWRWLESMHAEAGLSHSERRKSMERAQIRLVSQKIVETNPDLVIYIATWPSEAIRSTVLRELRGLHKFKLCSVIWDSDESSIDSQTHDRCTISVSDLTLVLDSKSRVDRIRANTGIYSDFTNVERVTFLPTVPNPNIFHPTSNRVHDVNVSGSIEGFRGIVLTELQNAGIRTFRSGGVFNPDKCLPFADYARDLAQSKIVVNTQTVSSRIQVKGRVAQTLASGAFLLEQDNPESRYYLEGIDVEYWKSIEELVEKIRFYLANDTTRETKAARAHEQWRSRYSIDNFVETILAGVH